MNKFAEFMKSALNWDRAFKSARSKMDTNGNNKLEWKEFMHFWQTPVGKQLLMQFIITEAWICTLLVPEFLQFGLWDGNTMGYLILFITQFKTLAESISSLDNYNLTQQALKLTAENFDLKAQLRSILK